MYIYIYMSLMAINVLVQTLCDIEDKNAFPCLGNSILEIPGNDGET